MSQSCVPMPVQSTAGTRECHCLAHRFGNAADNRLRERRYPNDMTDAECVVVRPLLPVPGWIQGQGGQPEAYCHRAMLDAIGYLVDNGVKWRAMPADFHAEHCGHFLAGQRPLAETDTVRDGLKDALVVDRQHRRGDLLTPHRHLRFRVAASRDASCLSASRGPAAARGPASAALSGARTVSTRRRAITHSCHSSSANSA